jgi:tRNA(Ile)-lysidine synthase
MKVRRALQDHRLIRPGGRYLLAVSGGADSVALALAMHALARRYQLHLVVAHLNHQLRGRAADADARFVRSLAKRLGLPYFERSANVAALARREKLSIEMAARQARQAFFREAAGTERCEAVAVAHTADDQVETMLLRLLRGTGGQGLAGMTPSSFPAGVRIVRPLLDATRAEVTAYLKRRRQRWREDRTNADVGIPRNWVRHRLLPFLETQAGPSLRTTLLRTAKVLQEENALLELLAAFALSECRASSPGALDRNRLLRIPLALRRRALRLWLGAQGLDVGRAGWDTMERLERLLQAEAGGFRRAPVGGGRYVVRQYNRVRVQEPARTVAQPGSLRLPGPGVYRPAGGEWKVTLRIAPGVVKPRRRRPGRWPAAATVRWAAVRGRALRLRFPRPGDRIRPLGMKGRRKLQDVFVDLKVPREDRAKIPILECGRTIIWVPGYAVAAGFEVGDPSRPALHLQIERADREDGPIRRPPA